MIFLKDHEETTILFTFLWKTNARLSNQYITIFAQPELNNQSQPKLNLGTSDISKYMQSTITKLNSETTSNVKT